MKNYVENINVVLNDNYEEANIYKNAHSCD